MGGNESVDRAKSLVPATLSVLKVTSLSVSPFVSVPIVFVHIICLELLAFPFNLWDIYLNKNGGDEQTTRKGVHES